MTLTTYDSFLKRVADGYTRDVPIETRSSLSTNLTGVTGTPALFTTRLAARYTVPTLESGVTAYIPARLTWFSAPATGITMLMAKLINLGSIDISGASGTFTDANAMPTETQLGVSTQLAGPIVAEVTTVLNNLPGNLTITYNNQSGSSNTTASMGLAASAAVGALGSVPLASTDWGVTDVTASARSAGTTPTGVIKFWGLIPLTFTPILDIGSQLFYEDLLFQVPNVYRLAAGDVVGFFQMFASNLGEYAGTLVFVGDN